MPRSPPRGNAQAPSHEPPIASTSGTHVDEAVPVEEAAAPVASTSGENAADASTTPPTAGGPTEAELEAWAAFADEYHDIVSELPRELERNLQLLHELEVQSGSAQSDLKRDFLGWLAQVRPRAEVRRPAVPTTPAQLSTSARKKKRGGSKASASELTAPPAVSATESDVELAAQLAPAGSGAAEPISMERELELRKSIVDGSRAVVRMCTDKVALAVTVYDWVDRHIRRLDSDLNKYEDSLVIGLRSGTLPSSEVPSHTREAAGAGLALAAPDDDDESVTIKTHTTRSGESGREKIKSASAEKRKGKRKARQSNGEDEDFIAGDMPVDPNEPVYCYCQKVSYGEMIACDNVDCETEWYHLRCAGLDRPPKAKWYCTTCIEELGIQPSAPREPQAQTDRKPRKKKRW